MKTVVITTSILFLAQIGFSQTSITPIIGFEYTNLKDAYIPGPNYPLKFYTPTKDTRTFFIGIAASKRIFKNLNLKFATYYTQNEEDIHTQSVTPYTFGIKYQTVKNSLQIERAFFRYFYLNAGLGLNLLFDFKNDFPGYTTDREIVNERIFDPGLTFGAGISKWGIVADFHFFQGLISRKIWDFKARPMQVWRFSLGYEFRF